MHDCGCANRSGQDKRVYFTRVPSLVTNQGKEVENLSSERRSRWVSAISRDDLTDDFLENNRGLGRHFVSGKAAKSWDGFNYDWVPTLCLWHSKSAFHLSELMGQARLFLNGTCEFRELVPDRLVLLCVKGQ